MTTISKFHWAYVWIPLLGAFAWCSTLLAMLITWLAQGRPHYVSMDGDIAYISDIGADILKPLFITGSSITAVALFASLFIERWLRHSGRLLPNMRTRESVFGSFAVFFALVGGAGLVLLSIFDTKRHVSLHRLFLLIFMLGVVLSAISCVVEYRWISKEFRYVQVLRRGYLAKSIITGILFLLSIGFGVALYTQTEVGAVFEWVIAFGFTFYLLSFYFDLRQSRGIPKGTLTSPAVAMASRTGRTGR